MESESSEGSTTAGSDERGTESKSSDGEQTDSEEATESSSGESSIASDSVPTKEKSGRPTTKTASKKLPNMTLQPASRNTGVVSTSKEGRIGNGVAMRAEAAKLAAAIPSLQRNGSSKTNGRVTFADDIIKNAVEKNYNGDGGGRDSKPQPRVVSANIEMEAIKTENAKLREQLRQLHGEYQKRINVARENSVQVSS